VGASGAKIRRAHWKFRNIGKIKRLFLVAGKIEIFCDLFHYHCGVEFIETRKEIVSLAVYRKNQPLFLGHRLYAFFHIRLALFNYKNLFAVL